MIDDIGSRADRVAAGPMDVAQDAIDAASPPETQLTEGIPVHGTYCGPGHGDDLYNAPPIDGVDAACMRHDRGYGDRGYFDFPTDVRLMWDEVAMVLSLDREVDAGQRAIAGLVTATFAHLALPVSVPVTILREGYRALEGAAGIVESAAPAAARAVASAAEAVVERAKSVAGAAVNEVEEAWDAVTDLF
jgi:hypothetical protein